PLLAVPLAQCLEAAGDTLLLASLHRDRPERQTLLRALAGLYAFGYPVHWPAVIPPAACVPLPAYPWQHRRYWLEARRTPRQPSHHTVPVARPASLPLHRLRTPQPTFEATLSTAVLPYLDEHRLYEVAVLPTTVLAEMVQVAAGEVLGQGTYTLSDLAIEQALQVPADPPTTVQLLLTVTGQKTATFQLFSQQDESGREWNLHATGA